MNIDLFDYHLPPERIAQYPAGKRDESRLLVVKRRENRTEHRRFFDIVDYIEAGDVLVVNDSKVVHARLIGRKASTGATVELFLVGRVDLSKDRGAGGESVSRDGEDARIFPIDDATRDLDGTADFEVLAKPAKRLKLGDVVRFGDGLEAEILLEKDDGGRVARFRWTGSFRERIEELGNIPLPPYIKRPADDEDVRRYQTVYSDELGSLAAPTAGLHFTRELMGELREIGVTFARLTLHVGLGTFRPVKTQRIEDHVMHSEFFHVGEEAARAIACAKESGNRVICVGTTALRAAESAALRSTTGSVEACEGNTDIFIRPGCEFRVANGLITNFHLPKSTLLMLVSAFYDRKRVLEIYEEAVAEKYRFFSYGDAMLLL